MTAIIQQIAEEFIKKEMEHGLEQGLSACLEASMKNFKDYLMAVLPVRIQELDGLLAEKASLRTGWQVVHKNVKRELQTEYGLLRYERRYYWNEKKGRYAYLVDVLMGIDSYERVERGLGAKLCRLATEHAYEKSSALACEGAVSRQTVMRKLRQVKENPLEPGEERGNVPVIHIQADEDHVAMQDGRRDSMVKLAVIHEPARRQGKRTYLPQRYCLSSYKEHPEEFWLRIANEVSKRYGDRDDLKVYIHGDGASWIRGGLGWIANSRFVLDAYHVSQYMRPVSGGDESYMRMMRDCLQEDNYPLLKTLVGAFIDQETCPQKTGEDFLRYVHNNWDGIQIWSDPREEAGGSCAEGLVSHILSDRLSSRPKGWMDEGLETVSRLRVYRKNGGEIQPEHLKKDKKQSIRWTNKLLAEHKRTVSPYAPMPTEVFRSSKRNSALHRLHLAIAEGGMVI
jgi:hypothetical protein